MFHRRKTYVEYTVVLETAASASQHECQKAVEAK
jgi:hypothetical protein